jgi:hypothetical protein
MPASPLDKPAFLSAPRSLVTAETEDQLVAKAQQHAKEVHQMDLTREDALSMAKPSQA